jgi:cytochrome c-type biogenesis protein
MRELLFGTTLLASFLGGVVALLAPCCVSVMLPAYLATGFRSRGRVLAATLAFTAGLATVIVPIGLGAAAVSAAISAHHFAVYLVMGLVMSAMGAAMLIGWKVRLPMPGARTPTGHTSRAAYVLGAFSGIASACCAPVLAGVVVLAGASGSFPAALTVGVVYVAGMVAPLLVIALAWERGNRRWAKLLQGRTLRLRLGALTRSLPVGDLLAGLLLAGIGALTIVLAVTGPSMPNSGWRVTLSANLQHWAALATRDLSFIPGWVFVILAAAAAALLVRRARHNSTRPTIEQTSQTPAPDPDPPLATGCCADAHRPETPSPALLTESAHGQ